MKRPGCLFILSGPSGSGKTTLRQALLERFPGVVYSISSTTRKPRIGEVQGRDYHFISKKAFKAGIESGEWVEWAQVHGHFYGTSARIIDQELEKGNDILLDIDVQGTRQILRRYTDCLPIFIMPPSFDVLRQRLEKRGSETPASLEKRLADALTEISHLGIYRHVVINDRLEDAVLELESLMRRHRKQKRSKPSKGLSQDSLCHR